MAIESRERAATGGVRQAAPVAVVAESTCCLPPELARRFGVQILPVPFVFGDEVLRDGVDLTPAQFYARLVASKVPPKTSPPSPGEYLAAWRTAARAAVGRADEPDAQAPGVVSTLVDGAISSMERSARLALALAATELPGVRVRLVDTLSAGMGQGFVALAAARAAQAGQPLDAVAAEAERVSRRVRLIVALDTLDYLAHASRIPQVAALIGGALAIKPVFQLVNGEPQTLGRVRTRRRSIEYLFEQARRQIPAGARLHAAVQHACAPDEAAALEERIRHTFDCVELYTTEFTPVMGGYCGPGLLGVAFYCDEV